MMTPPVATSRTVKRGVLADEALAAILQDSTDLPQEVDDLTPGRGVSHGVQKLRDSLVDLLVVIVGQRRTMGDYTLQRLRQPFPPGCLELALRAT